MEEQKTIKDMSVEYIRKLALILEEIDLLKLRIITIKKDIIIYNQRVHALYCHIYGKVPAIDVEEQNNYIKKIKKVGQVFYYKKILNKFGEVENILKYIPSKYNLLNIEIEKRELHLRCVIERVGLTVTSVTKKRSIL